MSMVIDSNRIAHFENVNEYSKALDHFVISHPYRQANIWAFRSYKITGNDLYNQYKEHIQRSDFNLSGDWLFKSPIEINNQNSIDNISSAVNIEYCNEVLIPLLTKLSSMLFNDDNSKLSIPSYVGQIIVSNTLSSEDMVKSIYGGDSWQKIQGRFLLGVGANEANTLNLYGTCQAGSLDIARAMKTGGANLTQLQTRTTPGHSHVVNGMGWNELPQRKIGLTVSKSSEARYGVIPTGADEADGVKMGHQGRGSHTSDKGPYAENPVTVNEITGNGNINKTFTFTAKATVNQSCGLNGLNTFHNNLPPYLVQYIWERME